MFQECSFMISQWVLTNNSYHVGIDSDFSHPSEMHLYMFKQSGQWHLNEPVKYYLKPRIFNNSTFFIFEGIEYVLKLQRHPEFFVTVIVIPSFMMGALSVLALVIPVESGEKVSLAVTILLAEVVELLVLSDILPPSTAEDFPIVGTLVIFLVVLASVAVVVCVLVSALYFTPPCKCVPQWMIRVITSRVMDILFIAKLKLANCRKTEETTNEKSKQSANEEPNTYAETKVNSKSTITKMKIHPEPGEPKSDPKNSFKSELQSEINAIGWKMFAEFVDRIFLIIYLIVLIAGSAYFYTAATS